MRNFKNIALIAVLALSNAAFAVDSNGTSFGTAESTVTASGTYSSAVKFTLPAASLTIPSQQVRPGAAFTITIPVTNTTGRAINISAGTVTGAPTNVTITPPAPHLNVADGATAQLVYEIEFALDGVSGAALSGDVNLSFQILADDDAATPDDLELGAATE